MSTFIGFIERTIDIFTLKVWASLTQFKLNRPCEWSGKKSSLKVIEKAILGKSPRNLYLQATWNPAAQPPVLSVMMMNHRYKKTKYERLTSA